MSRVKVAFDFCISRRVIGAMKALYGDQGYEFLHLGKIIKGPADDEDWATVYKKFGGRIVISGDSRIAYRPHQAIAFIDNGFVSFFPEEDWCNLRGHEKAAFLLYRWPSIEKTFKAASPGTCWRVPCRAKRGELRLSDAELVRLEIPSHVLEAARTRNVAS